MPGRDHDDDTDILRIPLAEETLDVNIRERQEGVVRFRKRVEVDPVETAVDLRSDDLFIDRTPRDEVTTEARQPWYDGDTLVIPVYEERLVVEKRLVLIEEIRVRRDVKTERVDVRETLRREVVDIETESTPSGE